MNQPLSKSHKLIAFFKTFPGMILLIGAGVFLVMMIALKFAGPGSGPQRTAASMQDQSSASVQNNVPYTTQETLNTLSGDTDNLQKNFSTVQKDFAQLKVQQNKNQQASAKELNKTIQSMKQQNQEFQSSLLRQFKKMKTSPKRSLSFKNSDYPIGGGVNIKAKHFVWIGDEATPALTKLAIGSSSRGGLLLNQPDLKQRSSFSQQTRRQPKPVPYYTIPPGTILANVIPEQPIIGVIPKNGSVTNPQTVLFMVGNKNLMANDWHLSRLKGIQGIATCQGVFNFNHSAVQCNITSMTFIFPDGRISTVKAQQGKSLGQLATLNNNPYIPGYYKGNAMLGAVGTGFFAGVQGFGNALAQSQVVSQPGYIHSFGTEIKNAYSYSGGRAVGKTGKGMNQWWDQLMRQTTNYVYVPNWNPKTHCLLVLNAVIKKNVDIDYNAKSRKVNYARKTNAYTTNYLD